MLELQQFMGRMRSKPALFFAAGVLLVLNLGRMGVNFYEERRGALDSRIELLSQHQAAAQKLEGLRPRVESLEARKAQLDEYLFEAGSEEQIASSMQILLQEKVTKAGLQAESLRPIIKGEKALAREGGKDKDKDKDKDAKDFGEIAIKMRLNGTLDQFAELVMDLYRMSKLFRIESFVLKPTKKSDMQILLDLVGYYRLAKDGGTHPAGDGGLDKQAATPPAAGTPPASEIPNTETPTQ